MYAVNYPMFCSEEFEGKAEESVRCFFSRIFDLYKLSPNLNCHTEIKSITVSVGQETKTIFGATVRYDFPQSDLQPILTCERMVNRDFILFHDREDFIEWGLMFWDAWCNYCSLCEV